MCLDLLIPSLRADTLAVLITARTGKHPFCTHTSFVGTSGEDAEIEKSVNSKAITSWATGTLLSRSEQGRRIDE